MTDDEIFTQNLYDLTDPNHISIWWRRFREMEEEAFRDYVVYVYIYI